MGKCYDKGMNGLREGGSQEEERMGKKTGKEERTRMVTYVVPSDCV